ncbi:MAG: hypothetical protein KGZ80_09160 [Methylomonas sp.]|nr:hypothetical protein [Methylomonas sp.]PPD22767.1 MAG: hypothetical protein CTY23_00065 [Methylomonas sp.]PPD26752.1 MAG: hypothetical protein CTY22_04120 [Methylomonas sp.]PPD38588.1 MAG: hypothetical protein CTY21_04120 [Methylomonas sp.]PPD42793.1 MAG: hypothetical protein CTY17_00400 [Methylomonas sp.]
MNKRVLCCIGAALSLLLAQPGWSTPRPREAGRNDAAIAKLQGMVKSLTEERDAAKAENAQLQADIGQLKKDKASAEAAKDNLSGELVAQRSSVGEFRSRLDKTEVRLRDVSDRHTQSEKARNELDRQLAELKARHQAGQQQLQICGQHNVKLMDAANELLQRYEDKDIMSVLLKAEPLLQFKSVEIQGIVQEYQDAFEAHRYEVPVDVAQPASP